jgi:hypothetical protein
LRVPNPVRWRHFVEEQQDVVRIALRQLASPIDDSGRDRRIGAACLAASLPTACLTTGLAATIRLATDLPAAPGLPTSLTAATCLAASLPAAPGLPTGLTATPGLAAGLPATAGLAAGFTGATCLAAGFAGTASLAAGFSATSTRWRARLPQVAVQCGLSHRRTRRKDAPDAQQEAGQGHRSIERADDAPIVHIAPAPRRPAVP